MGGDSRDKVMFPTSGVDRQSQHKPHASRCLTSRRPRRDSSKKSSRADDICIEDYLTAAFDVNQSHYVTAKGGQLKII